MSRLGKVIAIDFDGTLFEDDFPRIGAPRWNVIREALKEQSSGTSLILWTCRTGLRLEEAVTACEEVGIHFSATNENLGVRIVAYCNDPRKVGADEYWDDRAVNVNTERRFHQ